MSSIIATTKYLKDNFERMKPETVKEMLELVYDSSIAELNMLDSRLGKNKMHQKYFLQQKLSFQKCRPDFDMLKEIANVNEINFHNEIDENEIVLQIRKCYFLFYKT
jgi:two-component system CheB/CheR fusion protein